MKVTASGAHFDSSAVCDLAAQPVRQRPFPHVVKDDFIEQQCYAALKASFPTGELDADLPRYSLYWGDPAYDRLLVEQPAWKALFDAFQSQDFVDYCLRHFGEGLMRDGCQIDLAKARYVPFLEDRTDKKLMRIRQEFDPHDLYVRMDVYQGGLGYMQKVHLDAPRRLVSMLVYFCDAAENGIERGELLLHPTNPPTWWPRPTKVRLRNNRMAMFACSPRAWHSVPAITALRRPRAFLQVLVSSSVPVWP
jgi:hypothetical protein